MPGAEMLAKKTYVAAMSMRSAVVEDILPLSTPSLGQKKTTLSVRARRSTSRA